MFLFRPSTIPIGYNSARIFCRHVQDAGRAYKLLGSGGPNNLSMILLEPVGLSVPHAIVSNMINNIVSYKSLSLIFLPFIF